MAQYINEPSHYRGHALDLIMTHTDNDISIHHISVVEGISDHPAIVCELSLPKQGTQKRNCHHA